MSYGDKDTLSGKIKDLIFPFKLWDEVVSVLLSKNNSALGEMRHTNYYMDLKGFYSGTDNVTYVYTIDGYPNELELSYRSDLRRCCRETVRISFINSFEKHQIQWHSPQMKAKLRTWEMLDNESGDVTEYNLHNNILALDNQQWRKESLLYLSGADIRRKRKLFKFRSVMLVSGVRGVDFDDTIKELTYTCKSMRIKATRVMLNIQDYLTSFSPFRNEFSQSVIKDVGSNVLTDELLARLSTYSQGKVGVGGLYWGTDVYSSFPCLKRIKKDMDTAENWLITSESGGGKSFFVKALLLQLLGSSSYNGTIMDIEGFEYEDLCNFVGKEEKVVTINMAEGVGSYFDPVEIVLTGDEHIDKDMYNLSTSFALSIFKTLLGNTIADEWVDIAINDAVSLTYTKRNVVDSDMDTWALSKGLTLFDVYDTLKSLLTEGDASRAITNKFSRSMYESQNNMGSAMTENDVNRLITNNMGYQKAIELAVAKTSRYFEPSGTRASTFSNRVTVNEISDAKLVVCSFGMAGKSVQTVDAIQMSLMQLCASNISYLRSIYSKKANKFNFKLWEEFQRWGGFPDADKTVMTALTGGRKLGDLNIIVTNRVADILDNDRFGILSNLNSIAIGCIWDSKVREALCERLSITNMLPELNKLVMENKDVSSYSEGDSFEANPYNKAFLIGLDKTIYALSRMTIPAELAKSKIFNTSFKREEPAE